MNDVNRMPIAEFAELGYLQEANRQFFHPHGLALETTRIVDGKEDTAQPPVYAFAIGAPEYELLLQVLADSDDGTPAFARLRQLAVDQATKYEVGDRYLSGVWDYRDDPEGMFFGDLLDHDDAQTKSRTVNAERLRHYPERLRLLDNEHALAVDGDPQLLPSEAPDVEPLDWTYPQP